jgi:hypothetical protein
MVEAGARLPATHSFECITKDKFHCYIFLPHGLGVLHCCGASFRPFSKLTQLTHSILLQIVIPKRTRVLCILPEALFYQIAEKMKIAPSDGVFAPKWPKMSFFFFSQGSHRKSKMSNARSQAGNASPNSFQLGEKIGSG